MKKIVLLGGGNVAYHLAKQVSQSTHYKLIQIYSRNPLPYEFASIHTEKTNSLEALAPADLYLLAVNDDAIVSLSASLPFEGRLVVHTSGSIPMNALNEKHRRGVCYPLQSFSKKKEVDWNKVPFCLETEYKEDFSILSDLASDFSSKWYAIDSQQRQYLHIAAVFLNNFTHHLCFLSEALCQENGIPFELLRPLLEETFLKTQQMPLKEAQTGPARRGDKTVIEKHLKLLSGRNKDIYNLLTQSILKTYGK